MVTLTPLAPQFNHKVKLINGFRSFMVWLFGMTQKFSTEVDVKIGGIEENLRTNI